MNKKSKFILMVFLLFLISLNLGCGVEVNEELDVFSGKSENWEVIVQGPHNLTKQGANKERKITAKYIGKEPMEDRKDEVQIIVSIGAEIGESRSITKIEGWLQNGTIVNYSGSGMPYVFDDDHVEDAKVVIEWKGKSEEIVLDYNKSE